MTTGFDLGSALRAGGTQMIRLSKVVILATLLALATSDLARAQDDVADIPSVDKTVAGQVSVTSRPTQ
jgi:hypothetical protein